MVKTLRLVCVVIVRSLEIKIQSTDLKGTKILEYGGGFGFHVDVM
jgi:hypothetical protein